jgi:TonB-dependent SusC/RagA subfamily outer membrane receptor
VLLKEYDDLLNLKTDSKIYRPTLFDFLGHNAIDFYKTNEHLLSKPSYKFEIDNENYFTNFLTQNLKHKDSTSQNLKALQTYQSLVLFHQNDLNPTAFITVYLEALNYINSNSSVKNKETLLLETYRKLRTKYRHHTISTQLDFKIAEIFKNQARGYNPKSNDKHRFKNKDALAICELAIKMFPKSDGANNCQILKDQILNNTLRITAEKHIPSNKPARLLVDYKNVDELYFKVLKISHEQYREFRNLRNDSTRTAFIKQLTIEKSWNSGLRNENDFQNHKTEIVIPKLPLGNYLVFASINDDKVISDKMYAYTNLQVTDIAIIKNYSDSKHNYQIVNRNTGQPIIGAKVNLKNYRINYRYDKPIDKNFKTDKNGEFSYQNRSRHRNVVATVSTENEISKFGDYYLQENYRSSRRDRIEDEEIQIKPFVFTDRSIYRPGQKAYFKAIFLKKQGEKSELFTNEFIEVVIENPNGEEVQTLDLKLNEYGSISGEFEIPNNGLTGEYTFDFDESLEHESKFYDNEDFDFSYNDFSISVEEYKRPKFKTEFEKVTETLKLNDSITAKGIAKAFSGSTISDAKVNYRVVRTANFPSWYRWYFSNYQRSESLEITHGETITDAEGKYNIKFKAIPDLKISKDSQPTFNYKVFAEVTDINGETHETETIIKVGYHALNLEIKTAGKIDKSKTDNELQISSKNLNDEFVGAKGTLKIFKLLAPKNPIRKRPWSSPDYQDISKEEFKKLFPHEMYSENDAKKKQKGKLVFETKVNTEKSKIISLKNSKKWQSGKYIAVIECKDRFGQTVKNEKEFSVYGLNDKHVADNSLIFIQPNKRYYAPNENVFLKIGSASKDITVKVEIEKKHKIVASYFIHLNNEIKTLRIPVKENDRGGFSIKYHYVNYNSFNNGSLLISVPYKENNLSIETLTFRDKLQPGADQTWAFKIKGNKKEKVAAEVLASMYDASLDEFKEHNWHFAPVQNKNYQSYGNPNNAYASFGNSNFSIKNRHHIYNYFKSQSYDQLRWFGFSFNNQQRTNSNYLSNIYSERKQFDKIITGVVSDNEGEPLPGVSVLIEGTAYGVTTDFDGNYSLKIKKNDVVEFLYIGFEPWIQKTKNLTTLNVRLKASENHLDEVVVVGYGTQKKKSVTGAVSKVSVSEALQGRVSGVNISGAAGNSEQIMIRGMSSINGNGTPLYVVDGVVFQGDPQLAVNDIESIDVLKDAAATAVYGSRGANGVVIINTKSGQKKIEEELNQVQARTNLNETAFFFPNLRTDKNGDISFEFTIPEALTKWKMQLLAHTKDLRKASKTLTTITQKELMVTPNAPRFLREGDIITISSKIASLTEKPLNGFAQLHLTDAITGKDINLLLDNKTKNKNFNITPKGNTQVSWTLQIPENIQAVQYKVVAKAGDFSDGEQNALPVLSNRMLVTETLPLWVNSNETKTFTLNKLQHNTSTTLTNHKLTLEMTSNPAWYALQALPYLMEYPYECAEQTFSKYYANSLGSHVVNSNPKLKNVFEKWNSSDAMISNLEKNQELKSIIIQETPWLRDAQSETEIKKRIALLFDLKKLDKQRKSTLDKLEQIQMKDGGFPWFKGNRYASRNITQHIATGFGHLYTLGIKQSSKKEKKIIKGTLKFLDKEITYDYERILKRASKLKDEAKTKKKGLLAESEYLAQNHIGSSQLHYLYMRSFFKENSIPKKSIAAVNYYKKQAARYWKDFTLYNKGLTALIVSRENNTILANNIVTALKENSINSEELGMYWKSNKSSWYWYQSPIETQSLLIEVFTEIENDTKTIDDLKKWLLKNKQTNRWKTTKATTEAVYALLLQGSDWLSVEESVAIEIGGKKLDPIKLENTKVEAGTGYFKTSWNTDEIKPEMATITIQKKDKGMAWGAMYWQYFENLDKITSGETSVKIDKNLFIKTNSDTGKVLNRINENTNIKVGDLITVRIEIKTDRDMEFVHMKDMRASGVEPVNVISKYKWRGGLGYYESTKDASTNFFFDKLRKGIYVFEYDVRVNNAGNFSNGITTIQCMYAPEFSSHSEGVRINID